MSWKRLLAEHKVHSHTTSKKELDALRAVIKRDLAHSLDFFESCRRKRNAIDYDHASVATKTEAEEILAEAQAFLERVESWIAAHYPKLIP